MTEFYLYPGYIFKNSQKINTKKILEIAQNIPLSELKKKSIEYGVSERYIDEYIELYKIIPSQDFTIREAKYDEGIVQCASGSDPERSIKEQIRRAFCILVLDECFKKGFSICLTIN